MIAGKLTETVTLYQPTVVRDSFGAETTTWTSQGAVHAEVKWRNGSNGVSSSEVFSENTLEVLIHSAHSIAPKWRIIWQGDKYLVSAVEKNRSKGFKRLICSLINE